MPARPARSLPIHAARRQIEHSTDAFLFLRWFILEWQKADRRESRRSLGCIVATPALRCRRREPDKKETSDGNAVSARSRGNGKANRALQEPQGLRWRAPRQQHA